MNNAIRPHIGRPAGSLQRQRQPRAIATRRAILEASAATFDAEGYAAASINTIIANSRITKGALYFHFASKGSIAHQLIEDWDTVVAQAFSSAAETGEPVVTQLRSIFATLARQVDEDRTVRAGMKLTLDPSVEGANTSYRRWIDNTSDLVEVAIASGAIKDTSHGHRLAWNLCAGFSGAANAVAVLREDLDLPARVDDLLTAHLSLVLER